MNIINNSITSLTAVIAALVATMLGGCSLMHDDLEPCPEGLDISFVYDYNMSRANRFGPDVNAVTVFVFDENGGYVTHKEESGSSLASNDFQMHLDVAPGNYKLVALAGDVDYASMLSYGGAVYRRPDISNLTSISGLFTELDHSSDGVVKQNGRPLAVHYQSIAPVEVTVKDMREAGEDEYQSGNEHAVINLMRHTNTLKLIIRSRADMPGMIDMNDYDIEISGAYPRILHDNSVDHSQVSISYKPYALDYETSATGVKDGVAWINFSRVMTSKPLKLTIKDRATGDVLLVDNNLESSLAAGREHPDYAPYGYSAQEYLDREHNFEYRFTMLPGNKYAEVLISVLNWSKRVQNVDF